VRIEQQSPHCTTVVLSRRNLIVLLAKLDGHPPGSACTIGAPEQYTEETGIKFYVRAEEDADHYLRPDREARGYAGPMHPDTELAIAPGEPSSDGSPIPATPHE
jgi:hypothetical protein